MFGYFYRFTGLHNFDTRAYLITVVGPITRSHLNGHRRLAKIVANKSKNEDDNIQIKRL